MATKFTRLADVPAVEEVKEEDSVLVVQGGEVKRAPKTSVGGSVGRGGGGDIVYFVSYPDSNYPEGKCINSDYDTLLAKIQNHEPIRAWIVYFNDADDYHGEGAWTCDLREYYLQENDGEQCIYFNSDYGYGVYIFPDNRVEIHSYD